MSTQDPRPPAPRGQPGCPFCRGHGYTVSGAGEVALAAICSCVGVCPRCHGAGRVSVSEGGLMRSGRCRCQMLPDRIALFNVAGLPARHAHSTIESFHAGAMGVDPDKWKAIPAVSAWQKGFRADRECPGLVLHGLVGRGKTHLLVGIVRQLVFEHGVRVRFVEFSRLLSLLKEGYSAGRSDTTVLGELSQVPVLAIDELGKGRLTDWELTIIDEVISRRYNGLVPTLGTTNYTPGAPTGLGLENLAMAGARAPTLGDRVGDRVWSRLLQMSLFVEVGGRDYRAGGGAGSG